MVFHLLLIKCSKVMDKLILEVAFPYGIATRKEFAMTDAENTHSKGNITAKFRVGVRILKRSM